jgi:hypothetical protein
MTALQSQYIGSSFTMATSYIYGSIELNYSEVIYIIPLKYVIKC